jgi:hypothetical protein
MDARLAVQRHVAEHLDVIKAELEANGAAAAEQVNATAESFMSAVARSWPFVGRSRLGLNLPCRAVRLA